MMKTWYQVSSSPPRPSPDYLQSHGRNKNKCFLFSMKRIKEMIHHVSFHKQQDLILLFKFSRLNKETGNVIPFHSAWRIMRRYLQLLSKQLNSKSHPGCDFWWLECISTIQNVVKLLQLVVPECSRTHATFTVRSGDFCAGGSLDRIPQIFVWTPDTTPLLSRNPHSAASWLLRILRRQI